MNRLIFALALLLASAPALASGFFVPPWAEALFMLFFTPAGWVVLGVTAVAIVALIVKKARK